VKPMRNEATMSSRDEEELRAALDADVHVHFRSGDVDVIVCRGNCSVSVEVARGEVAVLLLALKNRVEVVVLECGEASVSVCAGFDPDDDDPEDLVSAAVAHADSDWSCLAMLPRGRLVRLLSEGCPELAPATPSSPPAKCGMN
jgi:hypothetical protein